MVERLPLRTAKMTPPPLPAHVVARPRLVSMFSDHDWRIATVVAGAGAGKSTLAGQVLAASAPGSGAQYQADEGDNRPERFWPYVVAALDRTRPGAFAASDHLLRSRSGRAELFVSQLLHDAERLDVPVTLVLEDLHSIRDRSILATLAEIVEYLPGQLRFVVTSRRDLELPVARWRARSWTVELRQQDVAFDHAETARLVTALGMHGLDDEEIELLRIQTEGLAAALHLASHAARGEDVHDVVRMFGGNHRMVADFIGAEVIDKQPAEVREFMVRTSIAETLDPELCDAISGMTGSEQRLRSLESETHFVTVLDRGDSSYRYHPLLRDVLRAQLLRRDPLELEELHRVAADALARRGHSLGAAQHLVAAGDHDAAFKLLFEQIGDRWEQGDVDAAAAWLDALPVELMDDAQRMLLRGLALCTCWRLEEASAWLIRANSELAATRNPSEDDLALRDALALMLFAVDGAEDPAIRGQRMLDANRALPDVAFLRGREQSAVARAQLLDDAVIASEHPLSLGVAARIALRSGQLVVAADHASRALTTAETFDRHDQVEVLDARLAQLGVAVERDELAAVPPLLEALHDLDERYPVFAYRVLVGLDEVRIVRARSGLDDALVTLAELRSWFDDRVRPTLQSRLDALEARLLLDAGEVARADAILGRLRDEQTAPDLLEARLLLQRGDSSATRAVLRRLTLDNARDRLDAGLLDVRAAMLLGDDVDGPVTRVIELAAPERFVRVLREEDDRVTSLVRRAAEHSSVYGAERLAAALGAPPRRRQATTTLTVSLSDREHDVLRFLPTRLTNAEIASECFMSVNTVKAHLKKIYSKLAVTTRAQAVERARVLGELPTQPHVRVTALGHSELSGARA